MSKYLSPKLETVTPYTPGEQPQDQQYIKLNTNESPYLPSPAVVAAVSEHEVEKLRLYSDPACTDLLKTAAAHFGLQPDQIMPGNGSDENLFFALRAFCDETHPLAYADITYGCYSVWCGLMHIPSHIIPLKEDFTLDPADYYGLNETIVIANPNAPTGLALPRSAIEDILKANPDNVVIVDEAYVDFGGESCVPLIDRYDNLLVVQTFSKSRQLAGARLGLAMGSASLIADLNRVKFSLNPAKKVLLADAVGALWTDIIGIADSPSTTFVGLANASTPLVWLGVIAYSLQLYFDFSGYSLMAIGMGKMLGFDFPQNFNFPYISRSITEFWRRWHMTLSGWFREYVYIPLGGNRKGLKRQIFNLFVVELLTGIWHGADWNFICWGLYYFVLLALEKLFLLKYLEKGRIWPHIYTMFLVVVGWAMFVGNEAGVGFGLLFRKLFLPSGGASPVYFLRNYGVLLAVSILCCTPLIEKLWNALRKHTVTRVAAVLVLLVLSTAYVVGSTNSPFLYFNF